MTPSNAEALEPLIAYRWTERLNWSYQDIIATPPQCLALCEKFNWSRADLLATPAQALRDFQTIHKYEQDLAK